MADHGLTDDQVDLIRQILVPHADVITQVDLFGSRATGNYRANSDIDLVLYGPLSDKTVDRLWTLFSESSLPFKVDLTAYRQIAYPPLKEHIDAVRTVLFTQDMLRGTVNES